MGKMILYLTLFCSYSYSCVSDKYDYENQKSTISIENVDSVKYESVFDPSKTYEIRHYFQDDIKDSLFIFKNDRCIYKFFCREEDENMGYFVEDGISLVNEQGDIIKADMLESNSILFIPMTMSFNGWTRIFTYDLKSGQEVLLSKEDKKFDIYSRGHAYIKGHSIFCLQGTKVDDGYVKQYQIKNSSYVLKKTYKYKEAEYTDSIILRDIMKK